MRWPALCGPPLNEVRSGIKTDTERKGERGEGGGTDGSNDCPLEGEGGQTREELAHLSSPLPDQLLQD